MYDKPVEEIRERRQKLLQEQFGGSIKAFGDAARKWEREHPGRVVDLRENKRLKRTYSISNNLKGIAKAFLSLVLKQPGRG